MKIKFLGAARQVTGSCYLLEAAGTKFLVDCGQFQERHYSYRNWESFPVPPSELSSIILTHVHLDHSGLIPKLVREGFSGKIYLTPASKEMFPIVLTDAARVQEEDAAFKKKRHTKEGRKGLHEEIPLYTVGDVESCYPLLTEISYGEEISIGDGLRARLHDAGHILGSAMVEVTFGSGGVSAGGSRNIVFSGDIGQYNRPLMNDPTPFKQADYVVMESTYGARNHESQEQVDEKLCEVISSTVRIGGNVLIPTFAIERAQELLYHFGRLRRDQCLPGVKTFLDSPMAVEITKVFERFTRYLDDETRALYESGVTPFDFPGLELVNSIEQSKAIDQFKGPVIIMSGSGMLTGGRIKHHLTKNIADIRSVLLFVGYQAVGTLGRLILDGASPVRILGQSYPVRIRVQKIEGFSAHAGANDLRRWVDGYTSPPRRVFLTHGEEESISSLAGYLSSKEGWRVTAPEYMEEFEI